MVALAGRILFVIPYRLTEGGMPDDTKMFISAVQSQFSGSVALLTIDPPPQLHSQLHGVDISDLNSGGLEIHRQFQALQPNDVTVFITFSNLMNVSLAKQLRRMSRRYCVLPAWQVSDFLDWDRPFPKGAVPTIRASEASAQATLSSKKSGVVEGQFTFLSVLRAAQRKVFRNVLGRRLMSQASGIYVFSAYERDQIERLVRPASPRYLDIRFGAEVGARSVGPDNFPDDGRKNIVYWGRADYFYKGLDVILQAIALSKRKGIRVPFTFWTIGPNYNQGHEKLRRHIFQAGIEDYVRILEPGEYTPGTDGLLRKADFCIMASRWDGFARTLREASALGVPFISNPETHFDRVAARFGNGLIFGSTEELAQVFANLSAPQIEAVARNAKSNAGAAAEYLSWNESARDFIAGLSELKPISP